MKIFLSFLLVSFTLINAKIIDAQQLFNKKITQVKKEDISITKEFYANSVIIEDKVVDIVIRFDGYITKLNANRLYMDVKKNQPLFSIYSDEIYNISQELKITKDLDKSLYNSSLDKLKVLAVNKQDIEKIKNLKNNFEEVTFYSPIDGIILQKNINFKSFAKKGNLLLQLAAIDKLWVIAKVYETDLKDIKVGQKVKVYFDGINTPIESKVDFIYPNVDPKSKTVDIRIEVENKNKNIYPNMFAKVKVKITKDSMLTLPKTAVLNKANKYYVFQPISENEFEPIEIEAKRISSNKYQIIEGLEENQKVIDNALFLLDSDAITNGLYNEDDDNW